MVEMGNNKQFKLAALEPATQEFGRNVRDTAYVHGLQA